MLQLLLKPLIGVASDVVGGIVATKKAKAEQKLTKIKAETELMTKQIAGEIDWDVEAVKGKKDSWADEFLTIILSIPLILAFFPGLHTYIQQGFEVLDGMPNYYKGFVGAMIGAAFGVRSVTKFIGKK